MKQSFNVATGEYSLYGDSIVIYDKEESGPSSLVFPNQYTYLEGLLKIQIRKDDSSWSDYEPGQMILAKKLECRLASPFEKFNIELYLMFN
ncbi:MAG: hypothetical protein K1X82_10635 [Bacteroidia bacterium]|nr:hypothetical protein [Bacteroidia bacterium]